jgi:Ca2+-binding EF-hand superfamily protein
MNTKSLLLLVLSAALLPIAVQAKPADALSQGQGKKSPPTPAQIIDRLDADQNGTLSQDEAKGPLAEKFDTIDVNGDGEIDANELELAREARKGEAKENGQRLIAADTDGNRALSKDEASAAGMEKLVEHFDKVDADGDGEISKEEMRELKKMKDNRDGKKGKV